MDDDDDHDAAMEQFLLDATRELRWRLDRLQRDVEFVEVLRAAHRQD